MLDKIKGLINKLTIKSNLFVLITSIYFGSGLNMAFWKFVFLNVKIVDFNIFLFFVSLIFFILFPLYLFFTLIAIPYVDKILTTILLLISSGTNYFMLTYGVYIDFDMIRNVFETNQREALDLFTIKAVLYIYCLQE